MVTIANTSQVDEYYLTAPETSEQDHFLNMVSTGHWAAIQDLKTLRWDIILIKPSSTTCMMSIVQGDPK